MMISWLTNHFICGRSQKWPQMSRGFILALPDNWVSCKKTHFENNMHTIWGQSWWCTPYPLSPSRNFSGWTFAGSLFLLLWDPWWSQGGTPLQFLTGPINCNKQLSWSYLIPPSSWKCLFHSWNFGFCCWFHLATHQWICAFFVVNVVASMFLMAKYFFGNKISCRQIGLQGTILL